MIQLKTFLKVVLIDKVIDNSGALVVECINVLGGSRIASLGDEIVVSVKKARPLTLTEVSKNQQQKLKKGDVSRALVVRTKKEVQRNDGSFISFDDNAVVMLNRQGQPLGNRILGPIAGECRQKRWSKIVSLAPKVI